MFDFFQFVIDWFNNIPSFLGDVFDWITAWIIVWKLKSLAWLAVHSWSIAENVLSLLNISDLLESAWSNIDSKALQTFTFFRIPEALNIVLNASVTKFVLRFLGVN